MSERVFRKDFFLTLLALFTSSGTLVCCALPALLVTLGLGASLAGFISVFPQIVWLSEYKVLVFAIAGLVLAVAGWLRFSAPPPACPADPRLAKACQWMQRLSTFFFWIAVTAYCVGFFFAFLAKYILL